MNFTRATYEDVNNTSLRGFIEATLNELIQAFGKPHLDHPSAHEKVNYEWLLKFEDGTIATVYDWKRYTNEPLKNNEIIRWCVGGFEKRAQEIVNEIVKKAKEIQENRRLEGTAEKPETNKTMNTIILNSETAANQYRDIKLELITHDIGFNPSLDIAKEISELGKDLLELLSTEASVAYLAFRDQFRTGCTFCFVSEEDAKKLEAWDKNNEKYQIAVFDNEGCPVGLYRKDVIAW
jgi:hypothetical protein